MPTRIFRWFTADGYPLTKLILLANLLTLAVPRLAGWLACTMPGDLTQPWRLVTYPLVSYDPFSLLWYAIWIWWVCGSLERAWGTPLFAQFYAAIAAMTALGLAAGAGILHMGTLPCDGWVAATAFMVGWAMIDPNQEIYVYGLVPIRAKWLALIGVGVLYFTFAKMSIVLGLCAQAGCLAAWAWVRTRSWRDAFNHAYRAPRTRGHRSARGRGDDAFSWRDLNPLERIARARRKKQFQRLFDDDDRK